ncbi:polyphosphate kinase 2 [Prochlorothrix hollandica]|uniref:ADP/GDP-polyphosphate phosphotransferase n=1 Tax=Prochlorothrix hollandica PCC 9006 = CALU 1027 TaxID=317619 RepID=A0A0M2PZ46_PROHO|nr:polyphosphate kinase 2 [Prochlorothrix hollandica]KKJ00328.1 polyphosphate kinase [Prochlorothrix hollandica PCC 9006 = CALU 1027]
MEQSAPEASPDQKAKKKKDDDHKIKGKKKSKKSAKKPEQKPEQKLEKKPEKMVIHRLSEGEGSSKISKKFYEKKLALLQVELVKMQYWVKHTGTRIVILFEGRDAAGKGGTIKRITEPLNPRGCRVVALGTPSDREKTEWYFQRYVPHLPAAGEIVCFDRSWYNRAGVEHVMGFCTDLQYQEFMHTCPEFERMLVRSGIILLKYWFSVSDEEQERRFQSRTTDPARRWKLSPMDLESRDRWADYSQAKDTMFAHTNIPEAPWFTVEADDKKRARLNCISHFLSKIPYIDMTPEPLELPPRKSAPLNYVRPPLNEQFFVPQKY